MRSNSLFVFLTALTSLLLSCREDCGKSIEMDHIQIPFDEIVSIDVNDCDVIPLETTDESLLSYVTNIEKAGDEFIVSTAKSIIRFDGAGKYVGHIGALGHGNSEYLDTRNMFISGNRLCVFDWNSRKINYYDASGKYQSKTDIQPGEGNIYPSTLYGLTDGTYLSNNCYQGDEIATPAFSVFSPSGELMYHLDGLVKKDGSTHNELRYSPSTNTLLYAEAFYDTIYRVIPDEKEVVKAYYVDFGSYKFTEDEKAGKDFVDLCAYSNLPENADKATVTYCCYETDNRLMFLFAWKQQVNFVVYDKHGHSARVFRLVDKTGKLKPMLFAAYTADEALFLCEDLNDMKNNPVLVRIPYNRIIK